MKTHKISYVQKGFIQAVSFYRSFAKIILTPLGLTTTCRFTPTCSVYMCDAITKYGTIDGLLKGVSRILRCHPFSHGRYDPA